MNEPYLRPSARHFAGAWDKGYKAFQAGQRLQANPYDYTRGMSFHRHWLAGWMMAHRKKRLKR